MIVLKEIKDSLLHLLFPHICAGCASDLLDTRNILCMRCMSSLPETRFEKHPANPVEKIFYGRIKVETAGSAFYFTKHSLLQHLVIQLKYRGNKDIGFYLGKLLGYQLLQTERFLMMFMQLFLCRSIRKKKESVDITKLR